MTLVFRLPGSHQQTCHSPAQRWAHFLDNPRFYPLVIIDMHQRMRRCTAMYQAFKSAAWVRAKTLTPIARTETPAHKQSATGIQRPHELGLPSAETCLSEPCPAHARGLKFGHAGVRIALAAGDIDEVADALI